MLIGAAIGGVLLWLATQLDGANVAGYWAFVGLAAAAGVVLAVAQLAGGWTKWGAPRVTGGAFLLGFVPALLVGGWVLLASQPEGAWMQATAASWADQLALGGVFEALSAVIPALALGLGLLFGYTFDTTGSRVVAAEPAPANDRARRVDHLDAEDATVTDERRADVEADGRLAARAEDEPVTSERHAVRNEDGARTTEGEVEYHEPDRDFVSAIAGNRREGVAADDRDRTDGDTMRTDEPERGESRRGWFGRR